ncbi:MAG: hypothetical protein CMJ83_21425 [Planctomycetes bacterium]|nr:hypothetical protein [Planctomycetota bacterium]
MASPPTVSVVVTNFDGEHYLPGIMQALARTDYPFHEVIVSDDASRDGSRLLVRHRYPDVKLVTSDANRGPGPARNAGMLAASGDLVLLLDNDGWPFADSIAPMVNQLEADPELVGIMPRVILRGDPPLIHCDGARTHPSGQMWLRNGHVRIEDAPTEPEPITSLMGTAMMVRRDIALGIGGFERDFFFYYEDHDFGTRMRILGGPLSSAPAARIDHLGGTADLSFRKGRSYPHRRIFLIAKNRHLFALRNLEGRTLLVLAPLLLVHEVAQVAFVMLKGWTELYFQGLRWNLTHLGRTLRKRDRIQSRRIVSDRSIMQPGPLPLHPSVLNAKGPVATIRKVLEGALQTLWRVLEPGLRR